jgi:hypothetical protein
VIRAILLALTLSAGCASAEIVSPDQAVDLLPSLGETIESGRPVLRDDDLPRARWERRRDGPLWTRVAMSAVQTHGRSLIETVPRDIAEWCPAYPHQDEEGRAKFWTAFLSTLSRYESTFNPAAVGGGGLWFGLLQIYPQTADFRKCRVRSGEGLKHGPSNLNCAVRIMSVTVPRDEAISVKENRWKGVAADWGPIRNDWMRRDMQRYTKRQTYCRPLEHVRPKARPTTILMD